MDETVLDEQRELLERIADAGWDVTDTELSLYESPWADTDDAEATVTITARKEFPGVESPGTDRGERDEAGEGDDEDDNPFRVQ